LETIDRAQERPTVDPLALYCPHRPWPKQQAFLDLICKEAFYGGAAAGGKSEALLMAAVEYVHVPGYAALILRKDTQRLSLSGGLIPRSHEWLAATGAKWNGRDRRWTFPTDGAPASISFGYLRSSQDKYRYGSSEYQFIAFDELTEFPEDDYLFLFSRLRKTIDMDVPLRMRAASNPGNLGHAWVKNRFINPLTPQPAAEGDSPVIWKDKIAYVPARIRDNPAVNEAEYRDSLMHLPTVVRERLMNGDWSVCEEGLIREDWLRYFTMQGQRLQLHDGNGRIFAAIDERQCRRFVTVDPAGTSEDRTRERRGKPPSWTVIQVWEIPIDDELRKFLLLRHVWRRRVGFDGLCRALDDVYRQWRPSRLLIEQEKLGQAAHDVMHNDIPIECISTGGRDKVTRAAPLINKLERGEVFLPKYDNDWRPDLEAEWLTWTGLNDETTDQIDAAAYAAQEAQRAGDGVVRMERVFWR